MPRLHFFNIQIAEDKATPRAIKRIKRVVARWYRAAYGCKVNWGKPQKS
ncbi:hypothetical protein ANRL1_02866 [Anaerolineae bacterium]|nr:hypothetical protein ANRL1_02866 [Anaerolineae bacterium]